METLLLIIYGQMLVDRGIADNWATSTHMRYHAPSGGPFYGKSRESASRTAAPGGNARQTEVTEFDMT